MEQSDTPAEDSSKVVRIFFDSIKSALQKGDKVEIELPMQVNVVAGNPRMEDKQGQGVIMRGPLVYCIEETDNKNYFEYLKELKLDYH